MRHIFALGDIHGHHGMAVRLCRDAMRATGITPSLILQVGDFDASASDEDIASMPVPARYRRLGDFKEWGNQYPAEVLYVAGNHEPVRLLAPIWGGGEVTPGVRFLGRSGVVERFGVRIAGLSGNYSMRDYQRQLPRLEHDNSNRRGQLHIRRDDIDVLLAESPVDILLLHDWPRRIAECAGLPFGRDASARGYREGDVLLDALRPQVCLLGHMHWYVDVVVDGRRCIGLRAVCDVTALGHEKCVILRVTDGGAIEVVPWRESVQ